MAIILRCLALVGAFFAPGIVALSPVARGGARLFLDTADTVEWDALLSTGIFHGVTTNPVLLELANQPCTIENLQNLAEKALNRYHIEEFMVQTWGSDVEKMVNTGLELSLPARDLIVVKVPVTMEGCQAARELVASDVRVCLTACYHKQQAMLAAGVGAEYLAPYLGRMIDAGSEGVSDILAMKDIVASLQSHTRILVASIRKADQMVDMAQAGMDTFTFAPAVARELFDVPLTDKAASDFERAARHMS